MELEVSKRCSRALVEAERYAKAQGWQHLSTAAVLVGLARTYDSVACQVLLLSGCTAEDLEFWTAKLVKGPEVDE